jgi:hypothetical protein
MQVPYEGGRKLVGWLVTRASVFRRPAAHLTVQHMQLRLQVIIIIIIIINTPRKNEMKNKKLKRLENDMKVKLKTVKKGLI